MLFLASALRAPIVPQDVLVEMLCSLLYNLILCLSLISVIMMKLVMSCRTHMLFLEKISWKCRMVPVNGNMAGGGGGGRLGNTTFFIYPGIGHLRNSVEVHTIWVWDWKPKTFYFREYNMLGWTVKLSTMIWCPRFNDSNSCLKRKLLLHVLEIFRF